MIKDITIGQYIDGDSYLHRADPRTKIVLTLLFMIVVLVINNFIGYIMLTIFIFIVIIISSIPLRYTLKGLKPVLFIITFATIMNVFFYVGSKSTILFQIAFIKITYEGIYASIRMFFVVTLIMMGSSLMTLTTTPILLTDGLEKLLGPLKKIKVPVHEIAMMMTIALRFIPTLLEETDKIMKAQASRGADFETGNLIHRAKSFIPILVPLFVSAFRRADELATAMEARCYRGSEGRTRMKQLKYTRIDVVIIIIMIIFSTGIIAIQLI